MYNEILKKTNFYDIYNKVVKYILKKRRSEKEIRTYLNKFDLNTDDFDMIIDKLKSATLLDDRGYCKAFINDNIYLSKNGIVKIRNELLKNDIPLYLIDEELNNIDTQIVDDNLEKLILKKIKNNRRYSNYHLRQKILNEMLNLGYSKVKVLDIIDKNIFNDENILEREFNKIYINLKRKYDGIELQSKIKQKLLIKGFDLDKINNLVQEKTEI